MRRLVYRILGLVCVALGVAGIFLPIVPATDFFLIALWLFARSSQKLHDWLVNHRVFGRYVRDLWVRGGMTRRSKVYSIVAMSLTLGITAATVPLWIHKIPFWVMWTILGVAWIIATVYISTRKTLEPEPGCSPAKTLD
jgi:uncharacterized membrane protein YbaN (DUF454 family)